jgi:flagellar hook-associated protein 3 FlgL
VGIARVTQNSMSLTALANLQTDLSNLATTQSQLATGRLINRPSDDPGGTAIDLATRLAEARNTQYQRNTQDGLGWLGTADSALSQTVTSLTRIRTLMVQSQDASNGPASQQALAAEIGQLRGELISTANSTYNGNPIFAGAAGVTAAYTATGLYQGDANAVNRQVSDTTRVSVALPGTTVFGAAGADVFALLQQVTTDITTNPGNIANDLNSLDQFSAGVQSAQTQVGAAYNRVQSAQSAAQNQVTNLSEQRGQVESTDIAQATINLQLQQVSYQAALSATAKALQPSLLDFLK